MFAAFQGKIAAFLGRTVVAGENDDGVVAQAELVELIEDGCDIVVKRPDHRGVGALGRVRDAWIHALQIRFLGLHRRVDDVKWHITKKRPVFVVSNEIHRALNDEVLRVALVFGPQLAVVPPTHRAFALDRSAGEVVGTAAIVNPCFIETVLVDSESAFELFVRHVFERLRKYRAKLRCVGVIAVMPLAENASAIAVCLEAFGDGGFLLCQFTASLRSGADPERMPTCEQHCAGRRTDTPAHKVVETDSLVE